MFDAKILQTIGMITATVRHPRTGENFDSDFYVTGKKPRS